MFSPEFSNNRPEVSLIPEEFLGKSLLITSGNGERALELVCSGRPADKETQLTTMTISLSLRWGLGFKNMITASVQENPATGERQLGVSLAAIPRRYPRILQEWEILAVEYSSENDGWLSSKPGRIESFEVLQTLKERGIPHVSELPKRLDLEATIKGFVEIAQDILKQEKAGEVPEEFPMPRLVPQP